MIKDRYTVVWAKSLEELQDGVNNLLAKGWTCQGGLTIWVNPRTVLERSYYQPMVLMYD